MNSVGTKKLAFAIRKELDQPIPPVQSDQVLPSVSTIIYYNRKLIEMVLDFR